MFGGFERGAESEEGEEQAEDCGVGSEVHGVSEKRRRTGGRLFR